VQQKKRIESNHSIKMPLLGIKLHSGQKTTKNDIGYMKNKRTVEYEGIICLCKSLIVSPKTVRSQ
jgi:hypothetical protein